MTSAVADSGVIVMDNARPWRQLAFAQGASSYDHTATGYPLRGKHEDVRCEACHQMGVFRGVPTECAACHPQTVDATGLDGHQT